MLCITLCILDEAGYLDFGWPYGFSTSIVHAIIEKILKVLNIVLAIISFPTNAEECSHDARKFRTVRKSPLNGVIAALDNIAVAIQ